MSHFPKPFFRKSRNLWYVQLRGKQINLGRDKETAFRRYHALLSAPPEQPVATDDSQIVILCDKFLSWVEKHRSAATYEWYRHRLQRFVETYPRLTVGELKPFHVQEWIDAMDIKPTTQRNYIRSIKRAMKWSRQQGYIKLDPIAEMEAPSAERREEVLDDVQFQKMFSAICDEAFADLVRVAWDTGCRPQELLRVEARHFDPKGKRWLFPSSESKMKKTARVVYLTDAAAKICTELAAKHPTGPLFHNANGKPWKNDAVQCAWRRVRVRLGKEAMQEQGITVTEAEIKRKVKTLTQIRTRNGKRVEKSAAELRCEAKRKLTESLAVRLTPNLCFYTLRHSFATRALLSGIDSLTVSQLLGHSDVSTLAKVYQHLSSNPEHLLGQVNRVGG